MDASTPSLIAAVASSTIAGRLVLDEHELELAKTAPLPQA
jgi:hypothetical protein